MKALLALTLLANLALAAWIVSELKRPTGSADVAATEAAARMPEVTSGRRAQGQATVITNTVVSNFRWRSVEAREFKTYMANLRAIGCPEETVRDIIMADVDRVYARKTAGWRKPPEELQFWKTGNGWSSGTRFTAEEQKQLAELNKEKESLLKELLGDDFRKDIMRQHAYGFVEDPYLEAMPKEKKTAVQEIQAKFNEERSELYRKAKGYISQEDQEELKRIAGRMHEEMGKILGPQELFEYEVRTSELASNMKYNDVQAFDANEQEFRAIFKAKQEAEQMNQAGSSRDKDWQVKYRAAQDELKTALGEERYRQYERSKDNDYQNLMRLTDSRDLPRDAADQVFQLKEELQKAASEVRRNKEFTDEQRAAALQAMRIDTEKAAIQVLGERNFNAYKRNAYWLRSLTTDTRSTRITTRP